MIPYISSSNIENCDFKNELYWSNDFSASFYIKLASKGLISTSMPHNEWGDILLPELQKDYAVLDFDNLHIGKKIKKLYSSDFKLIIGQDLDLFIPELQKHHGEECWFTTEYINLVYNLCKATIPQDNFRLNTTLLYNSNKIASGEIGYFIGSTYTSLTGFFNRSFSNWGTFQLILLGQKLGEMGIDFWNLGHPYMEYKMKIGAKILNRSDFLDRWNISSSKSLLR